MPIKSFWNHSQAAVAASVAAKDSHEDSCRKGEPNSSPLPVVVAKNIFCVHNSIIESKLIKMHEMQRAGNKEVQREIDQYLVTCLDQRFKHLIIPRNCVPHYDNLPDMFQYALGILDPRMDCVDGLQQILLLLRQCLPLRRRTKRAQREVQWKRESMFSMQTLIRCIQGLLLGLYPTSLYSIAFKARIGIYTFLRTVLVQPFHVLQKVMQKISYILKLGVMEHLCNVTSDYYPSICHTLNQSGQMVEHFCNSVSTICDIFRSELNTFFCMELERCTLTGSSSSPAQVFMSILTPLEKIAHSYFERCTRAYRGIIIGNTIQPKPIDVAKKLLHSVDIMNHIKYIIENIHVSQNKNMFDIAHFFMFRENSILLHFAWLLTEIIKVKPLPSCIIEKQLNALSRRYSGDTYCMEQCKVLHICIVCVIKKGGACGMRLRHDCQTDEIQCIYCGSQSVLSIDVLGRIVTIGNDTIVLSSCCGQYIHYSGTGYEFATKCGVQCLPFRQLFRKKQRTATMLSSSREECTISGASKRRHEFNKSSWGDGEEHSRKQKATQHKRRHIENQGDSGNIASDADNFMNGNNAISFKFHGIKKTNRQWTSMNVVHGNHQLSQEWAKKKHTCEICQQKNIYQTLFVLDVQLRCMIGCSLCSKHTIPQHVCCSILETSDIHRYIHFFKNGTGSAHNLVDFAPTADILGKNQQQNHLHLYNVGGDRRGGSSCMIPLTLKKKRGRKKKIQSNFSNFSNAEASSNRKQSTLTSK